MFGVADLQFAHGAADGGQRALRDLHSVRVGIDEIEAIKELTPGVLTFNDIDFEVQVLTHAILGRAHFTGNDL